MTEPTPTNWDESGALEVLTFDIGGETLALEAVLVREILDLLPETVVPGAPPLVASVINFRGRIIPLADLRVAFGMPSGDRTVDSRIVVIEIATEDEPIHIGLRADKVHEVATLRRDSSEPPPAIGMRWRRDYVRDLVRHADGVVILPDLPAIFHSSLAGEGGDSAQRPASTVHQ